MDHVADPKDLFAYAIVELPEQVHALRASGASLDDHVWLYVDGSVSPGAELALVALQRRGLSPEDAQRLANTHTERARTGAAVFGLGMIVKSEDLVRALAGGEGLGEWMKKPVPPGHMRVVVVAGTKTRAEHVPVPPQGG